MKALYRRGVSYLEMKEFVFAERDLVAAHKVEPSNRYISASNYSIMFLFSKVEFVQSSERSTWASEAEEEKGAGVNACKNEQNVCLNVFSSI